MKQNQPQYPALRYMRQRHIYASNEKLNAALRRIRKRADTAAGNEQIIQGWKKTGLVWRNTEE